MRSFTNNLIKFTLKMKKIYFLLFLLLLLAGRTVAEETAGKSVWQNTDPNKENYFDNRIALTGPRCCIGRVFDQIDVISSITGLGNLLDDDLDNYTYFPALTGIKALYTPIISVRDTERYYAAGTEVGFCIVPSEGSNILSLDILDAMGISLYKDGILLKTQKIYDEDSGLLGLSVLNISDNESCAYISVTSEVEFDEVCLTNVSLADIGIGGSLKIKYAFVGKPKEIKLTTNGVRDYFANEKIDIEVSGQKIETLLTSYITSLTSIDKASIKNGNPVTLIDGSLINISITEKEAYIDLKLTDSNFYFKEGMEVGFEFSSFSLADVGVLNNSPKIEFYKLGEDKLTNKINLSAGLINLKLLKSEKVSMSARAPFDFDGVRITIPGSFLSLIKSEVKFFGAYVREFPDVYHHCQINPRMISNVCDGESSITLSSDIAVAWSSENGNLNFYPDGISKECTVTGMESGNTYRLIATAEDGCKEELNIKYGFDAGNSTCGTPLTGGDKYELSDDIYGSSGSLITINDIKNKDNILDNDTENYAEYTGGLSLINSLRIIGVKTKDSSCIYNEGMARVGFVVEMEYSVLDVDLLEFFHIRLYNDGKEILDKPIDSYDVLSVGAIGANQVSKLRFSIDLPSDFMDGTKSFDEMMLWRSGIVNLNISKIRIYYSYMETTSDNCGNGADCGAITVSMKNTGAYWNWNAMGVVDIAGVISNVKNYEYFIDDDLNTAMNFSSLADLSDKVFAIKMGRVLDGKHQLKIVTDNITHLANVSVIDWIKVSTYRNNSQKEDFTDWKVADVNVIGSGKKSVLTIKPVEEYDEIRITVGSVVNVLESQNFYGMYLVSDVDSDGIPDCEDGNSCGENADITDPGNIPVHICEGDILYLNINLLNAEDISEVYLDFANQFESGEYETVKSWTAVATRNSSDGLFHYELQETYGKFGEYKVAVTYQNSDVAELDVSIHPKETTWRGSKSKNWNNWDNWSRGMPYCCSDVIIPSGAERYPYLDISDENPICCGNIYFASGAELVNSPQLSYRKVWVDKEFDAGKYYLFSAPLQGMVTGDMFIPENTYGEFDFGNFGDILDENGAKESRFNPSIYQRVWQSDANGKVVGNNGLEDITLGVVENEWSKSFNAVAHKYLKGYATSVFVDSGNSGKESFVFRFPKEHVLYHYYTQYGKEAGEEYIERSGNVGRFVYESEVLRTPYSGYDYSKKWDWPSAEEIGTGTLLEPEIRIEVTKDENLNYGDAFLVGNPFMSSIDIESFLENNSDAISEVRIYDGNATRVTTMAADGTFITTSTDVAESGTIPPMEGFYVKSISSGATKVELRYTPFMLVDGSNYTASVERYSGRQLRLVAEADGKRSCMVVTEAGSKVVSEIIMDGEIVPAVALFALGDGQAYDIIGTDEDNIPLGLMTDRKTTVTIKAEGDTDEWMLYDRVTGRSYSLLTENSIDVEGTVAGRYVLVRKTGDISNNGNDVIVYSQDGDIIVKTMKSDIESVKIFDTAGRITDFVMVNGNEVELPSEHGIKIVEVKMTDGNVVRTKVL